MKILLTGATGFLGYRTLEKILLNPDVEQVIATGRTIKSSHYINHDKIIYQLGDLTNEDFANKLVSQADYIIHAAALSSPWGRHQEFYEANVITQKNLIQAAKNHDINRFIYISTPSIYFNSKDQLGIKESDPLPQNFINEYAATKRQAEIELIHSGIPYIILRPRALIGRGDTVIMPRLIKAFKEKKLKIVGNGKNIVDLTAVANVVHAIERSLIVEGNGLNQVYNISNGKPVLLWQCIENVLTLLGYRFSEKKLPYMLMKSIAGLMEWKSKRTNLFETNFMWR